MLRGDPDKAPIVMGDARLTASSYFDVPLRIEGESTSFTNVADSRITPEMVVQCSGETDIQSRVGLGGATHVDALAFMPNVITEARQEVDSSPAVRKLTTIRTDRSPCPGRSCNAG